jgi:HD-GYP domain-containing protein (c-di-GMP phosphodiesterase class II)
MNIHKKFFLNESNLVKDFHFQKILLPLRVIAGLSAIIFAFNFFYEIFVSYNSSSYQKWALSFISFAMSLWALIESLYIARLMTTPLAAVLRYLLAVQLAFLSLRIVLAFFFEVGNEQEWQLFTRMDIGWRWIFLTIYSVLFIAIIDSIIRLFSLNEKNKAQALESQMLSSLNALAKARDNETGNHIIRTQLYVKNLALRLRKMGYYESELSDKIIDLLYKAAPLHDIGKVGIPDDILLKPGRLSDDEWQIMKTHTTIGEAVLSSAETEFKDEDGVIAKALKIAGGHHEKWDGSGYPRGLSGTEIPLAARIMSVADIYDALVSERVYKKGWTHREAIQEIIRHQGTYFDPLIVEAFIAEQDQFQEIAEQFKDE